MSRRCRLLSFAVVVAVALCAGGAIGESGGTTFDFRALSCRRTEGGSRSCQSNLVSQATKWELLACIHSADLPKQHALRLEKERYVKGSLDQDGMRVLTDRSFESAAASAGEPPSALSGSYRTFVRLPDASGGTYRVSFSYTMLHSAGNLGGCLIWQSDGSGERIGKLTMLKLADFEDDFIPFSRTVKVLPGAERLEVDLRIYGTGELRVKDISLAKETAQFPFETELTVMGLLDGVFAIGEGQMGALCFGCRQTDDTQYDRGKIGFSLDLPEGYEYLGNSFSSRTEKLAPSNGMTRIVFRFNPKYDAKVRKEFSPFKPLAVAVRACRGAMRAKSVFRILYGEKEMARPCTFELLTVPPVRGTAPRRLLGGFDLGGACAGYDTEVALRAFADLTVDSGFRCVVLGGASMTNLPTLRAAGVSKILTGWSGCCNGYVLGGLRPGPVPEAARFKLRNPKECPWAKRAICPSEIYEEGPFFREVFLPALKDVLAGADGLWANWEPYTFSGQGCVCERCEKKRAAFAGEEHEFRSREHAKVIKTIDKWVRAYTDERTTMGFLPGVSAKQMTTGWRRVYGKSEFKEYDYADSLEWIEPWGPYVYWDARTPYARMMHPTVLTFAAAKNIREMTDRDYGAKAPKLMAFPQGVQGCDWVTQPEYLAMAYDAHFFNRWQACLTYYFPRGYDARYWQAAAAAMTRAAKYEDFILDGVRTDDAAFVVPPTGYPVCRKPEEYLDGVENVSLLQSVSYELNDARIVAVFNYADDRACDFLLRCTGLSEGNYRLSDESGRDYGVVPSASLDKGVSLSIPATRTCVFEVKRVD